MKSFNKSVKFFAHYLGRYWFALIVILVLTIAQTYMQVHAPVYMGNAINDLIYHNTAGEITKHLTVTLPTGGTMKLTFAQAVEAAVQNNTLTKSIAKVVLDNQTLSTFYKDILAFVGFLGAMMVIQFINAIIQAIVAPKSVNNMRKGLFAKMQRMTVKYFDSHQDGDILARFTSDLDNIFNAMNQAIFQAFAQVVLIIGIIWQMFNESSKMAWVTIASTPVAIVIAVLIMRLSSKYINAQQSEVGELNGYINEQINGEKILITYGQQAKSVDGFEPLNKKVRQSTFKGQFWSSVLFPIMQGMSLVNTAIVIFYGAWAVLNNSVDGITIGLIVTFMSFSIQYYQPITQITSTYNQMQLAFTGAARINEIHDQADEVSPKDGKIINGVEASVELKDVHFGYNEDKEILHGINATVEKGHMVALVGPTGSGKTTVMNLLNRFYDVNSGSVEFDGVDVRDIDLVNLRNNVGIVLQDSVLFSGTVRDNIAFGKPDATDEEVIAAAKQANIHEVIENLPDRYDTKVSDENSVFSTGQKQLLSIARTILTDPQLLILDEATSNVDTVTEARIQKAMDNVLHGRTSFVIAHRLKTILGADKIIVLKDGEIIEQGTHAQLMKKKNGFYRELYTNQTVFE
ncbi:MAG: ABC transporter ATP-binding protein/permease [Lactobacillaceae bacterium]|jgi:ATP-binding cassette subfamily B multidrug efflux pump|nr:ABC transporter ATP-binding protein/permease [Lactobacillaceae bacterium]